MVAGVVGLGCSWACSSTSSGGPDLGPGSGGSGTGAFGALGGGAGAGNQGGGIQFDAGGGGNGGGVNCNSGPNDDQDGDGFTPNQGDCNDCDANANPGAFDVPGNSVDEDCNGQVDDEVTTCDSGIPDIGYADPMSAAQALGLCKVATPGQPGWGVLEAKYVKADGSAGMNPLSHGLLPNFGPNVQVQEGVRLLALSSGAARRPGDVGYLSPSEGSMGTVSQQPPGFPIDTPACPGVVTGGTANDPAGLELKLRVPTNAKSFTFNFNFYTSEYPVYICTQWNDFFVVLQNPAPTNAVQGNISFDAQNNPVSVNNGLLEVCTPGNHGGKTFACPLGVGQLQGTGFEGSAATGWLETQSPVEPGSEVTLRFTVYDVGDDWLDSTVLIDNFKFSVEEATGGSVTKPVPR